MADARCPPTDESDDHVPVAVIRGCWPEASSVTDESVETERSGAAGRGGGGRAAGASIARYERGTIPLVPCS